LSSRYEKILLVWKPTLGTKVRD